MVSQEAGTGYNSQSDSPVVSGLEVHRQDESQEKRRHRLTSYCKVKIHDCGSAIHAASGDVRCLCSWTCSLPVRLSHQA